MKDNTIYQLCIQALRYSQNRDNHLAPQGAVWNITEALKDFKDKTIKLHTIDQLRREIHNDLIVCKREQKYVWNEFYIELGNIKIKLQKDLTK